MSANNEIYLTTAELAARLKYTPDTMRSWRLRGVGPRYCKPNGQRGGTRYKLSDVIAWEEQRMTGGDSEGGSA